MCAGARGGHARRRGLQACRHDRRGQRSCQPVPKSDFPFPQSGYLDRVGNALCPGHGKPCVKPLAAFQQAKHVFGHRSFVPIEHEWVRSGETMQDTGMPEHGGGDPRTAHLDPASVSPDAVRHHVARSRQETPCRFRAAPEGPGPQGLIKSDSIRFQAQPIAFCFRAALACLDSRANESSRCRPAAGRRRRRSRLGFRSALQPEP